MVKLLRIVFLILWVAIIIAGLVLYFVWPEYFAPQHVAAQLQAYQSAAFLIYAIISVVRGFTLLPSTPLVIAGTIAFPGAGWTVLMISMIGIIASSSMIYWFSDVLGISEFLETRNPVAVANIRRKLEHPTGIGFVFLWAFFPLVPTDAVCYVAGSIRMNFLKFIAAIGAGELVLCSAYVFSGGYLMELMK